MIVAVGTFASKYFITYLSTILPMRYFIKVIREFMTMIKKPQK